MIKPDEINSKLEEIQEYYKETYEMFDYLNHSRDSYILQNIDLEKENKTYKKLCIYLFCGFCFEFVLFLICTII